MRVRERFFGGFAFGSNCLVSSFLLKEEFGVWNPRFSVQGCGKGREGGWGVTVSFNDIWMKSKYKRV